MNAARSNQPTARRSSLRVLICTSEFASENSNPWLWDDLAQAFVDAGHHVDVVVHSPTVARPRGEVVRSPAMRVLSVGAQSSPRGPLGKALSYAVTAWRLHRRAVPWVRDSHYDLCLYSSIGAFSFGFPSRVRRSGIASTLIFLLWDFFPIHHIEIERVRPAWLARPLKAVERRSFAAADVVALMSEANREYFLAYHQGASAATTLLPPWTSDPTSDAVAAPPPVRREAGPFTAVFGGQLVRGRGVETLIRAAAELRELPDLHVVIAGGGSRLADLTTLASDLDATNVTFAGRLPRHEYRELLQKSHVGVAITVEGVSAPTFPSKIAEYCANGLPVVAALEVGSDAGALLDDRGAGLAVDAGNPTALADALRRMFEEHRSGALARRGQAARALFESDFSASVAVSKLAHIATQEW